MTHHAKYIQSVIDKAFEFSNNYLRGLQVLDIWVPKEMIDPSKHSTHEGIGFWKPIPADVIEEDFRSYEKKIGFSLPETYKDFLSYKYFIELNFGHEAEFFRHTKTWVENHYKEIQRIGLGESLDVGLIPFARETDRGYFCFDTNEAHEGNEYKIVYYCREFGASPYPSIRKGQFTFIDLIKEMEERLDQWQLAKQTSA